MIFKEDIAVSISRSWKRKDTGEDFYDTSKAGNIADYIIAGIKDGSWADENDKNCLFTDLSYVKNKKDKKELLDRVACSGGFRLGGVLTVKGKEGYRVLRDTDSGKEIMEIIKDVVSERSGINKSDICFLAGIHKNTIDRHIHFLLFSKEEEKKHMRIKETEEEIRERVLEKVNRKKERTEEEKEYEMKMTAFLSGTLDLARNTGRAGIKLKRTEDLPLILKEEIRAYAGELIRMSPENKEKDRKIREKISSLLLEGNADKKLISEYFSDEFYFFAERDVFYLIKSTASSLLKTASSSLERQIKKDVAKTLVKKHAESARKIIEKNRIFYSEKLGYYLEKLISTENEKTGEEEKSAHMGNVSLL